MHMHACLSLLRPGFDSWRGTLCDHVEKVPTPTKSHGFPPGFPASSHLKFGIILLGLRPTGPHVR